MKKEIKRWWCFIFHSIDEWEPVDCLFYKGLKCNKCGSIHY